VTIVDRWFSPGTPFFSINNTDRHDITEILLKVALTTVTPIIHSKPLIIRTYGSLYCHMVTNREYM